MSAGPRVRHEAGSLATLVPGEVRAIRFAPSAEGMRREALVLRDERGDVRAFRNLCKHLPILLDAGSRRYLTPDGAALFCATHGARYRLEDGLCVHGPCKGASLDPVPLEREGDALFVVDDGR